MTLAKHPNIRVCLLEASMESNPYLLREREPS